MNVSFDGLRKNATRSMNILHTTLSKIIDESDLEERYKKDLIKEFNDAAMFVDWMMLVNECETQLSIERGNKKHRILLIGGAVR